MELSRLKRYILYAHHESCCITVIQRDAPEREKLVNNNDLDELEDHDTVEDINMAGRKWAFLKNYDWVDYEPIPIVKPEQDLSTLKYDF